MANDKSAARLMIEGIMSGYKLDTTGNLVVISEDSAAKAKEIFGKTILETSRMWWTESKEEQVETGEKEEVSEDDESEEEVTEAFNLDSIFEDGATTPGAFDPIASGAGDDGSSGDGTVANAGGSGYSEGSSGDAIVNSEPHTYGSSGDGVMPITGDGSSGPQPDGSQTTSTSEGDGLDSFDLSFLDHGVGEPNQHNINGDMNNNNTVNGISGSEYQDGNSGQPRTPFVNGKI